MSIDIGLAKRVAEKYLLNNNSDYHFTDMDINEAINLINIMINFHNVIGDKTIVSGLVLMLQNYESIKFFRGMK